MLNRVTSGERSCTNHWQLDVGVSSGVNFSLFQTGYYWNCEPDLKMLIFFLSQCIFPFYIYYLQVSKLCWILCWKNSANKSLSTPVLGWFDSCPFTVSLYVHSMLRVFFLGNPASYTGPEMHLVSVGVIVPCNVQGVPCRVPQVLMDSPRAPCGPV